MTKRDVYPEYKDSGIEWIGEIPSTWKVLKLKRCLKVKNGKEIEKELDIDDDNAIDVYGSGGTFKKTDKFLLDKESVLFGRKGTIGKPMYVKRPFWTVDTMYYTEFRKSMIPRYFFYLFHIFPWDLFTTKTALPSIVGSEIENSFSAIPDTTNQILISQFLDQNTSEIDSLISDKEKLIELLEEKRQAIITEAVTKGLNPDVEMKDSRVEWIGGIPKHWELNKVGYLGRLQNGISKSAEQFGFGEPFVSYSDVYKNMVLPQEVNGLVNSSKEEQDLYSVKEGDVFFTRTSETIEEIGIASTCLENIDRATFAGFLIRFRPTTNKIIPSFSKYYFRSDLGRRYFVKEMNLVTRASLGQGLLRNFPVILPSVQEQRDIVKYLDEKTTAIVESVSMVKQQIKKLKEYRQSIIYEAVTGKINVRDYEKLPS